MGSCSNDIIWHPLFDKYRQSLVKTTEACDEYHLFSLLTAIGCFIGKTLCTPYGRKHHCNFMSVLVGDSAISRKTTAQRLATDLLYRLAKKANKDIAMLSSLSSAEGLLRALGAGPVDENREGIPTLINVEEFATILRKGKQDSTSNLTPRLTELYDLPPRVTLPRVNNPISVSDPYFCLLTGTTEPWLENSLEEEEVLGGFCNRFLYCMGEPKGSISSPKEPNYSLQDEVIDTILEASKFWQQGHDWFVDLDSEADALWADFYDDWRQKRTAGIQGVLRERLPEYARKIALVLAFLDKKTKIDLDSMITSLSITKYAEWSLDELFSAISLGGREEKCEKRMLAILGQKNPIRTREMQHLLSGYHYSAEIYHRAQVALERVQTIRCFTDANGGKWLEFMP